MEIQAVVEPETPDEGMKWEAQSAEEMGRNTTLSWGLGVGMSSPSSGSRCAMSLDKYPASRSFWICPSVTEEAIHLPPAPDIVGGG